MDYNQLVGKCLREAMPSMLHQVLASLFRDIPALGLHLFQSATGTPLPPGARARLHSAQFTDVQPPEYSADAAYLIEDEAGVVRDAAIAEIQLSRDDVAERERPPQPAGVPEHAPLRIPELAMESAAPASNETEASSWPW